MTIFDEELRGAPAPERGMLGWARRRLAEDGLKLPDRPSCWVIFEESGSKGLGLFFSLTVSVLFAEVAVYGACFAVVVVMVVFVLLVSGKLRASLLDVLSCELLVKLVPDADELLRSSELNRLPELVSGLDLVADVKERPPDLVELPFPANW